MHSEAQQTETRDFGVEEHLSSVPSKENDFVPKTHKLWRISGRLFKGKFVAVLQSGSVSSSWLVVGNRVVLQESQSSASGSKQSQGLHVQGYYVVNFFHLVRSLVMQNNSRMCIRCCDLCPSGRNERFCDFSSVQSLCRVQLLATPWTSARQASLSITNSWSPPKPPAVQPSHPLLSPSPPALNLSEHQFLF